MGVGEGRSTTGWVATFIHIPRSRHIERLTGATRTPSSGVPAHLVAALGDLDAVLDAAEVELVELVAELLEE